MDNLGFRQDEESTNHEQEQNKEEEGDKSVRDNGVQSMTTVQQEGQDSTYPAGVQVEAETRVNMGECAESADRKHPNNPRITISEPVNSPCQSEDGQRVLTEEGRTQGAGAPGRCPIYYGIKSYLHDFYCPPDKEVLRSGEFMQEDDFQFLVEPGRRRWRGCWFRAGIWVGVNLMLLGIIAMLVGHLTPARETIVGQQDNYTILDRWAVTYNNRLVICQLAGLASFTSGSIIVMLVLLVSSYHQEQARSYYVMAATVVPETFVGNPRAGPKQGWEVHRIPLVGSVRGVQPTN